MVRELNVNEITAAVSRLCIDANMLLPEDLKARITCSKDCEKSPLGKAVLADIEQNLECSKQLNVPICQDTGMAVVFVNVGQDVHLVGGALDEAIHKGVAEGYTKGLLRMSIVADPIRRGNTNNNTPAVIHTKLVAGDKVEIMVAPKGFGSENMSAIKMLNPSATKQDIVEFVVQTIEKAGSNPCPPIVVGVGIGGDFELCAYLAKLALCRDTGIKNADGFYHQLEIELLESINRLGIGPQGFGGTTTALAVNVETYPTHIAGLPVAVNVGCHVTRHKSVII